MRFFNHSSFKAMNTDIFIEVVWDEGGVVFSDEDFAPLQELFIQVEHTLSRFLPESELSLCNAAESFVLSELAFDYIAKSLLFAEKTDGIYDPTVRVDVLGYDRSWEKVAGLSTVYSASSAKRAHWEAISLSYLDRSIKKPLDLHLDLGGMGKGYTVDGVAALLRQRGYESFYIDAGGDIFAAGLDEEAQDWEVTVQKADDPDLILPDCLLISGKSVATSSRMKRKWKVEGGGEQHHIVDPRSGQSATSEFLAVTCVAASCVEADVYAKVLLVLGKDQGVAFAQEKGIAFLGIESDGTVFRSALLQEYQRIA
ncbi:MAG: FAD:protein FMN transferase [bacterium]